jgi:hypothetical protein
MKKPKNVKFIIEYGDFTFKCEEFARHLKLYGETKDGLKTMIREPKKKPYKEATEKDFINAIKIWIKGE